MRARILTVAAAAGLGVLGLASPAFAHVEVSTDATTAGQENVTLSFNGEAENPAAGIRSEQVYLPSGITPAQVTLVSAPSGWTFTRGADNVTVGGKALKQGTDAVWKIKIAKLPDGQTRLSFKTLETYGNGDVSRWIEVQEAGQAEPDNPAPLVTLKPGTSSAAPVPSDTLTAEPLTPASEAPTTQQAETAVKSDKSSSAWIWIVVAAVIVIGGAAAFVALRRRPATPTED